jgi:hypothetical protein
MKTKRYFNQILKPYKNIIKEITGNYTDIRVSIDNSFACYCRKDYQPEITVPIYQEKMGKDMFDKKMRKKLIKAGLDTDYSNEIISFLHEVGHIYTYNKFNDIVYIIVNKVINFCTLHFSEIEWLMKLCQYWYFNQALEKNADKWAINYIKEHQEQVKQWQIMLRKNYNKYLLKAMASLN